MYFMIGLSLGVIIGIIVGYLVVSANNVSNSKQLNDLKSNLLKAEKKLTPSERLEEFKIKDVKDWGFYLERTDRNYLISEYVKAHDVVPYETVIDNVEYLYPTMRFPIRITKDCEIFYGDYRFDIHPFRLKNFLESVSEGEYVLKLYKGAYRRKNRITNKYTEIDQDDMVSVIEVPLKAFSAKERKKIQYHDE